MKFIKLFFMLVVFSYLNTLSALDLKSNESKKKIAYIVSDIDIPFWEIMSRGIKDNALSLKYDVLVFNSDNIRKNEIQNTLKAINSKVDAIILSPINSNSAATILKLASDANIPVVISDIGTIKGEYVSFISSNNEKGAYKIAQILAKKLKKLENFKDGSVGIISIPQKRANGKARTKGFMKAMNEASIKVVGLKQQDNFSYEETYDFTKELLDENNDLKAIWLQGSDKYKGALDAIKEAGKENEILLLVFDAEPEFIDLIPKGIITASAMQQPYLFGELSISLLNDYFNNKKVEKHIELPILAISSENIEDNLNIIKRNVLGILNPINP